MFFSQSIERSSAHNAMHAIRKHIVDMILTILYGMKSPISDPVRIAKRYGIKKLLCFSSVLIIICGFIVGGK